MTDLKTLVKLAEILEPKKDTHIKPVWEIGKQYLIRTCTMIDAGTLVAITDNELVLADAAWIADTGRFADCLINPSIIKESEPFKFNCIISRGAIVDATEFPHDRIVQK